MAGDRPPRAVHLDDLERVPLGDGVAWRPVRRRLGATGVGVNAYTAEAPGAPVIERHDELGPGAAGHEELYMVLRGRATFTVDGETIDAPAGALVLVAPDEVREAVAAEAGTTVLVVGGTPGAALPGAPYEHWYAAQAAADAGDFGRAAAIAAEGLRDWPDHGTLNYNIACFLSRAGRPDEALRHLRVALAGDPRAREWARDDADLDPVRGLPGFPAP